MLIGCVHSSPHQLLSFPDLNRSMKPVPSWPLSSSTSDWARLACQAHHCAWSDPLSSSSTHQRTKPSTPSMKSLVTLCSQVRISRVTCPVPADVCASSIHVVLLLCLRLRRIHDLGRRTCPRDQEPNGVHQHLLSRRLNLSHVGVSTIFRA